MTKLFLLLKLTMSQAVEGMWFSTGVYGQFTGEWVNQKQ